MNFLFLCLLRFCFLSRLFAAFSADWPSALRLLSPRPVHWTVCGGGIGVSSFSHISLLVFSSLPPPFPGRLARLDDDTTTFNDLMTTTSDATFHEMNNIHTGTRDQDLLAAHERRTVHSVCVGTVQYSTEDTGCVCFVCGGGCRVRCELLSGKRTYLF